MKKKIVQESCLTAYQGFEWLLSLREKCIQQFNSVGISWGFISCQSWDSPLACKDEHDKVDSVL